MKTLSFAQTHGGLERVLCLGAHCDDIEIGCGGTLLRLLESYRSLHVYWVVFSSTPTRAREAQASAEAFLARAGASTVVINAFRDGYFPYDGAAIKDYFETLQPMFAPDLIFTHYRHDRHQDHRVLNELTWNTFRDHLILEYEIPKYDGDLGRPNFYVQLDQALCDKKIELLMTHYATQANKPWFTRETFSSLLRLRGIEARSPGSYAEAYYGPKLVI